MSAHKASSIFCLASLAMATFATAAPASKRNIPYVEKSKTPVRHLLDVHYDDATVKKPKPIIFWVHGGAWKFGNKTHSVETKKKAFVKAGYILVGANYRCVPKVTFKEQAQDLANALAWVKQNAKQYGGDPQKIILMGHSAGAHLVALLGTDHTYLTEAKVDLTTIKGVIPLDGCGYDIPLQLDKGGLGRKRIYKQVFTEDLETQKKASPVTYIKAGNAYPDFLIIPCKHRAESIMQATGLSKKLTDAGAKAEVYAAEGKNHLSLNTDLGKDKDPPTEKVLEFLKQVTK